MSEIVTRPSDTDFYKLSMKAAYFHWYPDVEAEFAYTCRTPGIDHSFLKDRLEQEIKEIGDFKYNPYEIRQFSQVPYFKPGYIRFLETETWNPNDVHINYLPNGGLDMRTRAPLIYGMDWEIFQLEIVSELWTRYQMKKHGVSEGQLIEEGKKRLKVKLDLLKKEAPGLRFIDMGTRRRAFAWWHRIALEFIMEYYPECLLGTSNIYLANGLKLKLFGSCGHEFDLAHLAFAPMAKAKYLAMIRWMEAFDGDCGIALTDTFTTKHFLTIFNKMLANAYTGVRHDSGPWDIWARDLIAHYKKLGIDPMTKSLVFSDTLTFPKMIEIYKALNGQAKISFGIGTDLINSCTDLWKPLSIVVKMTKCNGVDLLKISDDPGKTMCENAALKAYAFDVFGVKQQGELKCE